MIRRLSVVVIVAACSFGGCAPAAEHGRVLEGIDRDPFVTIEAGNVQFLGYHQFVSYVIDRATQTCWLSVNSVANTTLSPMDCCAARRVEAVARITTWATDQTCGTSGSMRPSTP